MFLFRGLALMLPHGALAPRLVPSGSLPENLMRPDDRILLDEELLAKNVRTARRGAAPGPSRMTSEHLFPTRFFARAEVPEFMLLALRLGRMTVLKKPSGGILARTLTQRLAGAGEATALFQYALSTWAGCECVVHAMTDLDESATILSVGAFDLVSKNARAVELGGRRQLRARGSFDAALVRTCAALSFGCGFGEVAGR